MTEYIWSSVNCPACNGWGGWFDGDEGQYVSCKRCEGSGKIAALTTNEYEGPDETLNTME